MAQEISATSHFIRWSELYEEEKPFQVFLEDNVENSGIRSTNLDWEEKHITVTDFRGDPDYQDIDNHGFISRELHGFKDIPDTSRIETVYLPAVSRLLRREIADVGTVFIFDWRVSLRMK
jgi:hypothetical protein